MKLSKKQNSELLANDEQWLEFYSRNGILDDLNLTCIEIPNRHIDIINEYRWPLINEFHFKENSVLCKSSNSGVNLERNILPTKVFLEKKHCDINEVLLVYKDIDYIRIGKEVESISKDNIWAIFPSRIYLDPNNKNFRLSNGCLIDNFGNLYLIQKKKHISIDSIVKHADYFPSIECYGDGRYNRIDISNNSNFKEYYGAIQNKIGRILYLPDEKEIYIINCTGFAPNIFENHLDLERVIICLYENEHMDPYSIGRAISTYLPSLEHSKCLFRSKPLTIIVPDEEKYKYLKNKYDSRVIIQFENIESPDEYLE